MLEPDLLKWVQGRGDVEMRNVSNMINWLIREAMDGDTLEKAVGK